MALLVSLVMISSGSSCVTVGKRLNSAATLQGTAQAPTNLPELPPVCREELERVIPKSGEKWRGVQHRWEVVRQNENDIKMACVGFYEDLRARYAAPGLK